MRFREIIITSSTPKDPLIGTLEFASGENDENKIICNLSEQDIREVCATLQNRIKFQPPEIREKLNDMFFEGT